MGSRPSLRRGKSNWQGQSNGCLCCLLDFFLFFEQFPFSMPLSSPRSASCESSIHVKARSSFSPVRSLPNLPCIPDAIKAFQNLSNNLSTTFSLESDSQACSRGNCSKLFNQLFCNLAGARCSQARTGFSVSAKLAAPQHNSC